MSVLAYRLLAVCGLVVVCTSSALARGNGDTLIGVNLPQLGGAGVVFTDAMKQAAPWVSSLHAPLLLAMDGNVRMLRPGESAETVIYGNIRYPAGNYTLLYEGTGRFDIASQSGLVVQRVPGRMVLRINGTHGGIHLFLRDVAV
ncbi:MAG: hypothetical protein M3Z14_07170, partial [Candidatus Eremiobacteraeota bacterium]|nr:hypothetical protein [Candidatus Eremiobacteraeota bacterium]